MAEREKRYWMHRITGGDNGWVLSYPLLRDHNILSTGWSFLSSQDTAKDIQKRGLDAIKEAYINEGANFSRNAHSLNNFAHIMQEGDIVMVPEGRYVSFYQIADNNIITNETLDQNILDEIGVKREVYEIKTSGGQYIDLGFYRKVEKLALNIERDTLDKKIQNKTKAHQTNFNIDDVDYLIEQILVSSHHTTPNPIEYIQFVDSIKQNLENVPENASFKERLDKVFSRMDQLIRYGVRFEYALNDKSKKNTFDIWYADVETCIKANVDIVTHVISAYLKGDLFTSIQVLKNWWNSTAINDFPQSVIFKDDVFYRTRLKEEKSFKEKDLFHVPFDKRGSVTTKRYSVPGYPCLYLGKSIYVCWEEMRRPALSSFATSAFKAQEDIVLLDLRLKKQMHTKDDCMMYLKMLPIILACSLSVANDHDNFKPEYILPQLLLHIIVVKNQEGRDNIMQQENVQIGGINYTSSTVNNEFEFINNLNSNTFKLADCFVIPVKILYGTKSKYCADLCRKFSVTKPKYYENEFIKDSLAFTREYVSTLIYKNGKLVDSANRDMMKYDASYFSYMEKLLKASSFANISEK